MAVLVAHVVQLQIIYFNGQTAEIVSLSLDTAGKHPSAEAQAQEPTISYSQYPTKSYMNIYVNYFLHTFGCFFK